MRLWFIQNRSGNISSVVERAQRKTISAILCVGLFFSFVPDFFVIIPMFKVYRTDLVHTARTHCHLQLNEINFSLERTAQRFAKINFKQIKIDKIKYMNAVVAMSQRDSKINYNSIWHFFLFLRFIWNRMCWKNTQNELSGVALWWKSIRIACDGHHSYHRRQQHLSAKWTTTCGWLRQCSRQRPPITRTTTTTLSATPHHQRIHRQRCIWSMDSNSICMR